MDVRTGAVSPDTIIGDSATHHPNVIPAAGDVDVSVGVQFGTDSHAGLSQLRIHHGQ
jgi:hypothetical protein